MFYTEIVVFVVLSIENVGIEYSFTIYKRGVCSAYALGVPRFYVH
jgi:hypothetical protein